MNGRLSGKRIFLSASVPRPERKAEYLSDSADAEREHYRRIPNAQFEIEQAVLSLARAVFAAGGQLVFGGHPSISPLVATVAGEYRSPSRAESGEERPLAPVTIYQSEVFRDYAPEETLLMFRLGVAHVEWTPAVDDEYFKPGQPGEPCPHSLALMRARLLDEQRPDAMVCIGGMAGVIREARLFAEMSPSRPIYALRGTGGAAALLADHDLARLRVMDDEVMEKVAARRRGFETGPDRTEPGDEYEQAVIPYPLIMQTIVDEIAEDD